MTAHGLLPDPHGAVLLVRAELALNRFRFTVAHELAHAVLAPQPAVAATRLSARDEELVATPQPQPQRCCCRQTGYAPGSAPAGPPGPRSRRRAAPACRWQPWLSGPTTSGCGGAPWRTGERQVTGSCPLVRQAGTGTSGAGGSRGPIRALRRRPGLRTGSRPATPTISSATFTGQIVSRSKGRCQMLITDISA